MEFKIKQSVFRDALAAVQNIAEPRATIPVLSNIVLESLGENAVRIMATDCDSTLICDVEAEIKTPGTYCIQARKVFEVVRLLSEGDVTIGPDASEFWAKLECGGSKFRIAGVDRANFPDAPVRSATTVTVSSTVFAELMKKVAVLTTNDISRFTLAGIKCEIGDGKGRFVATDQNSLALADFPIDGNLDVLIPDKAFAEAAKLVGDVALGEDNNHIFFITDDRVLISRKLTGAFPNYNMILPSNCDSKAVVAADVFTPALRRVACMADANMRTVRMELSPGQMQLTSQSSTEGEGVEIMAADYAGPEITIRLDWKSVLGFASVVPKDAEISVSFKDANSPIECNIVGDDSYRYVIMPLRLQALARAA